jgi:hypothetical protein
VKTIREKKSKVIHKMDTFSWPLICRISPSRLEKFGGKGPCVANQSFDQVDLYADRIFHLDLPPLQQPAGLC